MGYNPNQPRDKNGEWAKGGAGWDRLKSAKSVGNKTLSEKIANDVKVSSAINKAKGIVNSSPFKGSMYNFDPDHRESYLNSLKKGGMTAKQVSEIDKFQKEADKAALIGNKQKANEFAMKASRVMMDHRNAQFKKNGY